MIWDAYDNKKGVLKNLCANCGTVAYGDVVRGMGQLPEGWIQGTYGECFPVWCSRDCHVIWRRMRGKKPRIEIMLSGGAPMGWIPISERLPLQNAHVLVYPSHYKCVVIGYWIEIWNEDRNMFENAWYARCDRVEPTHWMPLPAPPA